MPIGIFLKLDKNHSPFENVAFRLVFFLNLWIDQLCTGQIVTWYLEAWQVETGLVGHDVRVGTGYAGFAGPLEMTDVWDQK